MKIILGSESKNRKQILLSKGFDFEVMPAHIDEKTIRTADPEKLTLELAKAKALALFDKISEPALLITADQVVKYGDTIREKPKNVKEAIYFLETLSITFVETITAVVVTNTGTKKQSSGTDVAKVVFDKIPKNVIETYVKSGHPFTQAGGFSINHPILRQYVKKIEGTKESVEGLPVNLLVRLMEEVNE